MTAILKCLMISCVNDVVYTVSAIGEVQHTLDQQPVINSYSLRAFHRYHLYNVPFNATVFDVRMNSRTSNTHTVL